MKQGLDNIKAIHQWLPGFASGDAISNYAIALQKIIRTCDVSSEIFSPFRHISPNMRGLCKEWAGFSEYSSKDNIVIYHFSIGSEMSQAFSSITDKKVLIYHNITPDRYFKSVNDRKAAVLFQGREQLKALSGVPEITFADSEYNRLELAEWGYANTAVLPPLVDFNRLACRPDKKPLKRYKDSWVNFLFVGRIAPNKRIGDIIKVFYYYKNTINSKSRLFIVGSIVGMKRYYAWLKALALELGLMDIVFTGHVTESELSAYYTMADVFLCMSEHEGFGIPLLESMYFGVPVIAYNAAAVPYTLSGSGVLVKERNYAKIAELIDIVLRNDSLRIKVIEGQKKRLGDFTLLKIEKQFKQYIENLF